MRNSEATPTRSQGSKALQPSTHAAISATTSAAASSAHRQRGRREKKEGWGEINFAHMINRFRSYFQEITKLGVR